MAKQMEYVLDKDLPVDMRKAIASSINTSTLLVVASLSEDETTLILEGMDDMDNNEVLSLGVSIGIMQSSAYLATLNI